MKAAVLLLLLASPLAAGDWPRWLGPTSDGRAPDGTLRPGAEPRLSIAWRVPLGAGLSGVVTGHGRAYTLFSDGEADYAVAVALADGREAWRTRLDASPAGSDRGPSSTPVFHDGRLVTLTTSCQLRALEAADGKVAWARDLKVDFGTKLSQGCAMSPLVEGGQLIVQAGGRDNETTVVGLEPATGTTLWALKGPHRTTNASPVMAEIGGVRQLVVHTTLPGPPPRSGLLGLKLDDRSVLWSHAFEKGVSWESPVVTPDGRVVLSTWSDTQTVAVARAGGRFQVTPSWQTGDLVAQVSPAVLVGGHLYGFGGDHLACVDPTTGRTVWKQKLYAGSVAASGTHLVVLSVNAGTLRLAEATPAGYRETAKIDLFTRGSRAEAPPSLIDGHVLARNDEELVAVRVQ